MNVDAMLRELTGKQFLELVAYKRMMPFSGFRHDYNAASIVAMAFNVQVKQEHRKSAVDFLPPWAQLEDEAKPGNTRQQQISIIKAIAMAYSVPAKDST